MAMGHGEMTLDVSGIEQTCERAIATVDRHLRVALREIADVVSSSARHEHAYQNRTGALTNSIRAGVVTGVNTLSVEVTADTPYAAAIESGARPHKITAKAGGVLRFATAGGIVFAKSVNHPGNKAYRFLAEALEREQGDMAIFVATGLEDALQEAGFEVQR
jgi:hypothetical protein